MTVTASLQVGVDFEDVAVGVTKEQRTVAPRPVGRAPWATSFRWARGSRRTRTSIENDFDRLAHAGIDESEVSVVTEVRGTQDGESDVRSSSSSRKDYGGSLAVQFSFVNLSPWLGGIETTTISTSAEESFLN